MISVLHPAGAALYGLYPDTIFARKAVYAYGLKTRGTWREGMRKDLWREEPSTKKPYCDQYFSQLVAKDELLECNDVSAACWTALSCPFCLYVHASGALM